MKISGLNVWLNASLVLASVLAMQSARADDEIDVFAVTGSLTAIQRSTKIVGTGDAAEEIMVTKSITLSPTALINLARGNTILTASTTGFALGVTCEAVPRLVVLAKGPLTTIGDESVEEVIGEFVIDGSSAMIQEKRATYGGVADTYDDYYIELGQLTTAFSPPGFIGGELQLAIKETFPTSPTDLYPDCPLKIEVLSANGEFEIDTSAVGDDNIFLVVTKGTLTVARTRIGTIDAPP